jgi:hypothetical protein
MSALDIIRRKAIADIIANMSDEDRQALSSLLGDNKHREVMSALDEQKRMMYDMSRRLERQNWYVDFGSDILANFTTDALIWLGRKLFK